MNRLIAFGAAFLAMIGIASVGTLGLRQAGPVGQDASEERDGKWGVVSQRFSFASDK